MPFFFISLRFFSETFLVIFIHKIIILKLILDLMGEGTSKQPTTDLADLLSHVGAYLIMQQLLVRTSGVESESLIF